MNEAANISNSLMIKLFLFIPTLILLFSCNSQIVTLEVDQGEYEVELFVGDTLHLKLKSNPTTGYKWDMNVDDISLLQQIKKEYTADNSGKNIVGSGGILNIYYIGTEKGQTVISGKYSRPFEDDIKAIKEFWVLVSIK